jgi:uncharacterized protein
MFHELILQQTQHRPWPMPQRPWRMAQTWHDLLFAHWPVPKAMLRPHIPPILEIDTFHDPNHHSVERTTAGDAEKSTGAAEGTAWLSIVPFRMKGVRPRHMPGLPWLSNFAELNVRTYVCLPDIAAPDANLSDTPPAPTSQERTKPGVFFFSLDAANPLAVEIARRVFHLPYFNARMQCQERAGHIHYHSVRHDRRTPQGEQMQGEFQAIYRPTGGIQPATPGTLEHWLAERYALYTTDAQGRLCRGEIHHLPWPLQTAEVEIQTNTLAESVGLTLPPDAPLVQFSRRLDVLIWPLQRVTEIGMLHAATPESRPTRP